MSDSASIFGTDGVRAVAGTGPLAPYMVEALGKALSAVLGRPGGRAAACRDTRRSGPGILAALASGITSGGIDLIDAGVHATPAISWYSRAFNCDFSVVISASHNPAEFNGIKVFGPRGTKLARESEIAVERLLAGNPGPALAAVGAAGRVLEPPAGPDPYIRFLLEHGCRGGRLDGLRLVVDAANGAAFIDGPEVLRELGADVTAMNVDPDGDNINLSCGAMHPEAMARAVAGSGSFAGVALDGDADRSIFAGADGSILDGDFVMAALALHLDDAGALPGRAVVGTVMTNAGLEHYLRLRGITLHRTDVGDRNVALAMESTGAALGSEPSGHVIFAQDGQLLPGDGVLTALRLFHAAAERGVALAALAPGYEPFPQAIVNVGVASKPRFEDVPGLDRALQAARSALGDGGRVVLRYSGTEPKARVMVEGRDRAAVERHAELMAGLIRAAAGK